MTPKNSYAPQATRIRTYVMSALLVSILVATLCLPSLAASDPNWCNACTPTDESGRQVCTMQYCPPVITSEPLPPCCMYGPHGEPFCTGLGPCKLNPWPGPVPIWPWG